MVLGLKKREQKERKRRKREKEKCNNEIERGEREDELDIKN